MGAFMNFKQHINLSNTRNSYPGLNILRIGNPRVQSRRSWIANQLNYDRGLQIPTNKETENSASAKFIL